MKFLKRIKLAFYILRKGVAGMTLVYILALEMGLITKDNINAYDLELVRTALTNLGKLELLGE